jgi:hypothetical protein
MGSTAKFMVAATMLHHADKNPDILTKKINITKQDIIDAGYSAPQSQDHFLT